MRDLQTRASKSLDFSTTNTAPTSLTSSRPTSTTTSRVSILIFDLSLSLMDIRFPDEMSNEPIWIGLQRTVNTTEWRWTQWGSNSIPFVRFNLLFHHYEIDGTIWNLEE